MLGPDSSYRRDHAMQRSYRRRREASQLAGFEMKTGDGFDDWEHNRIWQHQREMEWPVDDRPILRRRNNWPTWYPTTHIIVTTGDADDRWQYGTGLSW